MTPIRTSQKTGTCTRWAGLLVGNPCPGSSSSREMMILSVPSYGVVKWCQSTFGKDPQLEHQGWLGKFCPFWLQDLHPTEKPHNWIEVAPDLGSTSQWEMGPKKLEMKLGWETFFFAGSPWEIKSYKIHVSWFWGPTIMARRCTNGPPHAKLSFLRKYISMKRTKTSNDSNPCRARGYLARPWILGIAGWLWRSLASKMWNGFADRPSDPETGPEWKAKYLSFRYVTWHVLFRRELDSRSLSCDDSNFNHLGPYFPSLKISWTYLASAEQRREPCKSCACCSCSPSFPGARLQGSSN